MFEPTAIADAVQRALATSTAIPDGHRGAFVTLVDGTSVKSVFAEKVNDTWTVAAVVEKKWSGEPIEFGATLQATWR